MMHHGIGEESSLDLVVDLLKSTLGSSSLFLLLFFFIDIPVRVTLLVEFNKFS